jgi:ferredoxin
MRVVVDYDLCEGTAKCVHAAPAVFQIDDNDQLHVVIERPSADQRVAVATAAALCPRQAITIVESE